jgi:hypothetical protein
MSSVTPLVMARVAALIGTTVPEIAVVRRRPIVVPLASMAADMIPCIPCKRINPPLTLKREVVLLVARSATRPTLHAYRL